MFLFMKIYGIGENRLWVSTGIGRPISLFTPPRVNSSLQNRLSSHRDVMRRGVSVLFN